MSTEPTFVYSPELMKRIACARRPVVRSLRKTLFSLHIWRPLTHRISQPEPSVQVAADGAKSLAALRLGMWNVRSVGNKSTSIAEAITDSNLDIMVAVETWHQSSSDVALLRSAPSGFHIVEVSRGESRSTQRQAGGGLAIFYKASLRAKRIELAVTFNTFEVLLCSFSTSRGPLTVAAIYRPGSQPPSESFIQEFTFLLEHLVPFNSQLVVTGDLNIHMEDPNCLWAGQLMHLMSSFGLHQHVKGPTHTHGGWLDLVITRDDCKPVSVVMEPPSISDHCLIIFTIPYLHASPLVTEVNIRGWKSLDRDAFRSRLLDSALFSMTADFGNTSAELCDCYEATLCSIVDELLPLRTVRIRVNPLTPWFDSDCRVMRRKVRRAERRYRRTKLDGDRQEWIKLLRHKHNFFQEKERCYWEDKIARDSKDSKRLWKSLSVILGRSRSPHKPPFSPDDFLRHLLGKVSSVRRDTEGSALPTFLPTEYRFDRFDLVTESQLRAVILSMPPKTSILDPIPTFLLHELIDVLLPFLVRLCNTSLMEGVLPVSQKRAVIRPSLKKPDMDPEDINNYRPVSNLSFLSKMIEKVVAGQMLRYLEASDLMPKLQSGFRKGHSTETVLARLISDFYDAIDSGHVTLLALLDVSAAFDTVDHDILLTRLNVTYGFTEQSLRWLRSFLDERTMMVAIESVCSDWVPVLFGVPQGSVLGPLLYILYTADLTRIITSRGSRVHQYADDVQLYSSCRPSDSLACLTSVLAAVTDVQAWMSSNRLRLNPSKTQFLWLGTRQSRIKINQQELLSSFPDWSPQHLVRDLGVLIDGELSLADHVNSLCRSCHYQLRQIRSIRRNLSFTAATTLLHSFVLTRLDYCNSILAGLPKFRLRQLQSVLNCAARLVANLPKFSHISEYMRESLHWLSIEERIQFKILLLGRASTVGYAPEYLRELFVPVGARLGRQALRSASRGDLQVPRFCTSARQHRALSCMGPSLWNSLPTNIRTISVNSAQVTFSACVKTHLFKATRQPCAQRF